jgi:hypothetical protein
MNGHRLEDLGSVQWHSGQCACGGASHLRWLRRGAVGDVGDCERPSVMGCERCGAAFGVSCGTSSRARCGPCGARYCGRVRRVFEGGLSAAGVLGSASCALTLTAPGDRRHEYRPGIWCPCTPEGGVNLAEWNAGAGMAWSRFLQALRREFERYGIDVEYAKSTEVQKRGALHFHALLELVGLPRGQRCPVPVSRIRALAIRHGFGHSIDFDSGTDHAGFASYCAKYVSKSVDQRGEVPWLDRETGELCESARYRTWSRSRAWRCSMREVKAAGAEWIRSQASRPTGAGQLSASEVAAIDGRKAGALDSLTGCSTSCEAIASDGLPVSLLV